MTALTGTSEKKQIRKQTEKKMQKNFKSLFTNFRKYVKMIMSKGKGHKLKYLERRKENGRVVFEAERHTD